jgi:hypothetical protein
MRPPFLRAAAVSLLLLGLGSGGAGANDSTASLDTGELVLVPNPHIELVEEDLFISAERIRVRYLFSNTSRVDLTTHVAFPLQPVDYAQDVGYAVDSADPLNFVGFRLFVDGQPQPFQIDARATVGERDVTALLASHGILLTTFTTDMDAFDAMRRRLETLPRATLAELRQAGAIDAFDEGFRERWTAHVTFYWQQTFPAGRTVEIAHDYAAVPQATFFTAFDLEHRTFHEEACIDGPFERGAARRLAGAAYDALEARLVRYILTTANNWRGPIGRFRLTIDKGAPENLVSLCADGIRKTGPTTFEWTATDFRPTRELTVLFLRPLPME